MNDSALSLRTRAENSPRTTNVWRARLASASLTLTAVDFVLLLAELGLRAVDWQVEQHRTRVRISNVGDVRVRANAGEIDCYPSNPGGYFDIDLRRAEDRARLTSRGYSDFSVALPDSPWCVEFRYNSLGLRGPEYGPRRPDVRRVIVLGDSFTEGQGVRAADTYVAMLGRLLDAGAPGHVEVLNFGQRALDFPDLYRLFERALELDPDLVVYGFVLNDGDRSPEFDRLWPRLNDWIMVRRPPPAPSPWSSNLAAFVRERLESARIARDTMRWYRDMYAEPNHAGWNRTRAYLRSMNATLARRGGSLLVALWPLLVDLEGAYPFEDVHARIARVCARSGIPFHDLLGVLRGRSSATLWVHPADWHPNALAHRLAAEDLAPLVRRLLEAQADAPAALAPAEPGWPQRPAPHRQ